MKRQTYFDNRHGIQHCVAEPRQRDLDSWLRCGEAFSKIFERAGSG